MLERIPHNGIGWCKSVKQIGQGQWWSIRVLLAQIRAYYVSVFLSLVVLNLSLFFFIQSRLVSSTHDGRITVDILDYNTMVHISSFQPEDRGQWQCLATNISGTATAWTTIHMIPGTPNGIHTELICIMAQAHQQLFTLSNYLSVCPPPFR